MDVPNLKRDITLIHLQNSVRVPCAFEVLAEPSHDDLVVPVPGRTSLPHRVRVSDKMRRGLGGPHLDWEGSSSSLFFWERKGGLPILRQTSKWLLHYKALGSKM